MTKPSDLAHQALARARKDHQEDMKHVDTSINEVLHALNFWVNDYGVDDFGQAIRLTEITLTNITEED